MTRTCELMTHLPASARIDDHARLRSRGLHFDRLEEIGDIGNTLVGVRSAPSPDTASSASAVLLRLTALLIAVAIRDTAGKIWRVQLQYLRRNRRQSEPALPSLRWHRWDRPLLGTLIDMRDPSLHPHTKSSHHHATRGKMHTLDRRHPVAVSSPARRRCSSRHCRSRPP